MSDVRTIEGQRDFVFGSWYVIAPYAYKSYKKFGRGALVVEFTGRIAAPVLKSKYLLRGAGGTEEDLEQMINQYHPDTEVVILFIFYEPSGEVIGHSYGKFVDDDPLLTPAALYDQPPRFEQRFK
jgi:hypothetical protein